MLNQELVEALRKKQIVTGFQPDGFGGVNNIYGPDPVTEEAAARIEALGDEIDALTADAHLREYERHAERARIEQLTAERDRLRAKLADAAVALDAAGMELSDFANCLSREPWAAGLAYEAAIDARAALKGESHE